MNERALHIVKVSGIGGAERHLLTLLPGLAARDIDPRILVATAGDGGRFVTEMSRRGIDVRQVPAGPDINPLLYRRIAREIREFSPQLVHTHLIHADVHGQLAAARAGVPAISSLHSAHDFYRRRPYKDVCRYVGRKARRAIAISHFVKRYAEELRLNEPSAIRVIHYGVAAHDWDASPQERELARRRYELAEEEVAFGIASRLIPGKGHSLLIEAFLQAVHHAPQAKLLVAGDGPLRPELGFAAGAGRERIRLLGFVEDVKSFLLACDALVLPTLPQLGEGFGLAALEAMATARPVIATRVGSLPEVVADGESGIIVSPDGPEELATAIARLAENPRERVVMADRGRELAEERFGATRMVERTLEVYEEVSG